MSMPTLARQLQLQDSILTRTLRSLNGYSDQQTLVALVSGLLSELTEADLVSIKSLSPGFFETYERWTREPSPS